MHCTAQVAVGATRNGTLFALHYDTLVSTLQPLEYRVFEESG